MDVKVSLIYVSNMHSAVKYGAKWIMFFDSRRNLILCYVML